MYMVNTACTSVLSVCAVFDGNGLSVLLEETQKCIRPLGKTTLSDLATTAISHANIGDQIRDTVVESQCSTN